MEVEVSRLRMKDKRALFQMLAKDDSISFDDVNGKYEAKVVFIDRVSYSKLG